MEPCRAEAASDTAAVTGHEGRFPFARLTTFADVAHLARAVATLRIAGEDLVPSDVSASLGCEPTEGWAKGDALASHVTTRAARFGMWMLRADKTEPADLDAQVTAILSRLTTDESVWAGLRAEFDVNLFCGWFMEDGNEGVSIEPDTLAALGTRGIRLDIDLYGADLLGG